MTTRLPVIIETQKDSQRQRELPSQKDERLHPGHLPRGDGSCGRSCDLHKHTVTFWNACSDRCRRRWAARVKYTFLSKSLSHMSLMVHPAPLISRAPVPKRESMPRCGRHPGSEARAMLHVQGRYSSHVPAAQSGQSNDFTQVNVKGKDLK